MWGDRRTHSLHRLDRSVVELEVTARQRRGMKEGCATAIFGICLHEVFQFRVQIARNILLGQCTVVVRFSQCLWQFRKIWSQFDLQMPAHDFRAYITQSSRKHLPHQCLVAVILWRIFRLAANFPWLWNTPCTVCRGNFPCLNM